MSMIFVSYRRADSPGHAGRIWDHITERFGQDAVFRDIDKIEYGVDFVEAIQSAVESCTVLIVVIGPHWIGITDNAGKRRLDNPEDFIRLEVATALSRRVRVIPVLVEGARMPTVEELPEDMKGLARRQALEVTEKRFQTEMEDLIGAIQSVLGGRKMKPEPARPPDRPTPQPAPGPAMPAPTMPIAAAFAVAPSASAFPAAAPASGPAAEQVPNYLVWSIISTACLCLPLGIVGIIKSNKATAAKAAGDLAGAHAAAAEAKKWNLIALGLGVAVWVIYLIGAAAESGSGY